MTRKPYSEMTDDELTDAAARKIMGWYLERSTVGPQWDVWASHTEYVARRLYWLPLTEPRQFMQVLDRLLRLGWLVRSCWRQDMRQYMVSVVRLEDANIMRTHSAVVFPRALLVAALTAIADRRKGR